MSGDPLLRFEREHEEALAALVALERAAEGLRSPGDPARHFAAAREAHAFLSRAGEDPQRKRGTGALPRAG